MSAPIQSREQAPKSFGRFIGLEAVGRERYIVRLLETQDGKVVRSKVLESGREGKGAPIAIASGALLRGLAAHLREKASELWAQL